MYVSGYLPQAGMVMAQGPISTSAVNPALTWTSQPLSFGSWAAPSMYSAMGYMLPFASPLGQAISYGFVPAAGTGMAAPAFSAPSHLFQTGMGLIQPRVELAETNSDIVVTAELPNINPNDLHLTVTDDSLTISCTAFAGGLASSVHRTIALPTSVRAEQVTANYSNGILECRLPKSDLMTRRRIRVNPIG